MNELSYLSPLIFGIIIGILIFYFVRQYKEYTAKQLISTISFLVSGAGISSLVSILDKAQSNNVISLYIFGLSLGFIIYILYLIVLAIIYKKEILNPRQKYSMFASCNLNNEEYEYGYLLYNKAEKLNKCFDLWKKSKLSDKEFIAFIEQSNISQQEYKDMYDESKFPTTLEDELIITINTKQWNKYFKN